MAWFVLWKFHEEKFCDHEHHDTYTEAEEHMRILIMNNPDSLDILNLIMV